MVRTRFAPSPTGYLHIGGVRTALFNWLFARGNGGQFVLRIDDTDQQRNVAEALEPILDGFRWLGLNWDEGPQVEGPQGEGPHEPYFQSQRGERYQRAVETLLERGSAYRDYSTPQELEAERETAHKEKQGRWVYSRRWMAETDAQATAFEAEGRRAAVRLKMPREGACRFHDLVRGDVEFAWAGEQDSVIQKPDGGCLYNLATVVDDADFQITHVIRSEEHLSNTPRQIFIAQELGLTPPQFAHLPYVAEPGGHKKLSKRKIPQYLNHREFKTLYEHGAAIAEKLNLSTSADTFNPVIVDFYREVGYSPDAIINYLLLLGWSLDDHTEEFTREQMIEHFTLERVIKSPAGFDPQKLTAFQLRRMQQIPIKQKVALVVPFLQKAGWVASPPPCDTAPTLTRIVEAAGDRIKTAGDILNFDEFFTPDDQLTYEEKPFQKRIAKPGAAPLLQRFREKLKQVEPFEVQSLDDAMHDFVEEEQIKIGEIIHAVRVAVTGKGVGLGMFDCLAILGRDRCLARIDRALSQLSIGNESANTP